MVQENNYNRMQSLRTVGAGINIGNYAIGDSTPDECLELLLENPDVNILTDAEYVLLGAFVSLAPANNDFFQFKAGAWANRTPAQVKIDLGINNIDNTSDANKPVSIAQNAINITKADLVAGKVPSAQLPSYVDDVEEYANFASFPVTGETGKIYISIATGYTYRWSGAIYVLISNALVLGETNIDAYRGDRGKIAYDHSQTAHDKAFVGLPNVDNTSDANKPVSTAQQNALNLKANLAGDTFTGTVNGTRFDIANNLFVGDTNKSIARSEFSSDLSVLPVLMVSDKRSMALGVGGDVNFVGSFTGTSKEIFGKIRGVKENGADGNREGKLFFSTNDGGSVLDRMSINSVGEVELLYGRLKFPSTPNPSSNANTLDDYKTNITWTPVDASGAGLSLTITNAKAIKIGDMVTAWADVTFPATADGTAVLVGGLPYNPTANTGAVSTCRINATTLIPFDGFANTSGQVSFRSNGSNVLNSDLSSKRFLFSITYFV